MGKIPKGNMAKFKLWNPVVGQYMFFISCFLYFLNFLLLLLYSTTLLLLSLYFFHRLCLNTLYLLPCTYHPQYYLVLITLWSLSCIAPFLKEQTLCVSSVNFLRANTVSILSLWSPYLAHRRDSTNVLPVEWINVSMSGLTKSEHNSYTVFSSKWFL